MQIDSHRRTEADRLSKEDRSRPTLKWDQTDPQRILALSIESPINTSEKKLEVEIERVSYSRTHFSV